MVFPSLSLSMIPPLLLHSLLSSISLLLPSLLHLPSLSLSSLHTYIHPDSTPSSSSFSLRAAIHRPSQDPSLSHRPPKSKSQTQFDESKAQLFRLRLSHPHLSTRLFFPLFRISYLLSLLSLSNLALHRSTLSSPIPFLSSLISLLHLAYSLLAVSLDKSAHRRSVHQSLLLAALAGFLISFFVASSPAGDLFDFRIPSPTRPALAALAAFLSAVLFSPASRAARSFWLGTDQLRWNLSVVSCGPINKILLYLSAIFVAVAPLLWFNPVASADAISGAKKYRVGVLFGSAVLQVLAFRPNLQMYLNEAVLCWYQRLHSNRAPDMVYGRAKVFLHNHYVCLAAVQFFGPPVMVMVLIGLSQMRGNLFTGVFLFGGLAEFSDAVKECALFLAWWVVFVQGVLLMSSLALYRMGVLIVS